jgi:hypothetical protein
VRLGNIITLKGWNPQETAENRAESEISFVSRIMPEMAARGTLVR